MIWLPGGMDQAAPLGGLGLRSDLSWACGQGCLDADRQRFRRADGTQLSGLCISIAACSTQSEHGVPGCSFPCVEGQAAHFSLGLCLEAQPGSVPGSDRLGVTGFLPQGLGGWQCQVSMLELKDADPEVVLQQSLPPHPSSEDASLARVP